MWEEVDRAGCGLELRLFGPFGVRVAGRPLRPLRSRRGLQLLALLTLRHGRSVDRTWLAGTLWPENREPQGLASLRQSLTDLRRALGPEAGRLRSPTPRSLQLNVDGVSADVVRFDAALNAGLSAKAELEAAVGLYRGPLLEGWTDDWALQERRQREQQFQEALTALAGHAEESGDLAAAARHLRRALAADPLQEPVVQRLMRLLTVGGDAPGAIRAFEAFRDVLAREVDLQPNPQTVELLERAKRERADAVVTASDQESSRPHLYEPRLLPAPLTRFIGRERELDLIRDLLSHQRLVTLTGPGGVGKTRLALAIAASHAAAHPRTAAFADLSTMHDAAFVVRAVGAAVGMRDDPENAVPDALARALPDELALLVLDNCEHVLASASQLASSLLQRCLGLRILATSREALGLSGEHVIPVDPLSLPVSGGEDGQRTPQELLASSEAVRLFVNRAGAVRPAFRLTAENAAAITRICHGLDGMPLALELAAARLNVLAPAQIAERLDDRFALLTGGPTGVRRQKTLRGALDWSYDLLSKPERRLFRSLSVFSGTFDLDAAGEVFEAETAIEASILDLIAGLTGKSLVSVEHRDDAAVYRLLETTREYTLEKLRQSGEEASVRERHARYFLRIAEALRPLLDGPSQLQALDRLENCHDNLRAALGWWSREGASPENAEHGLRMAVASWLYWAQRGFSSEGREWLAKMLTPALQAPQLRALGLFAAAELALQQGDLDAAAQHSQEALPLFEEVEDLRGVAATLDKLGWIAQCRNQLEAAGELHRRSLQVWTESGRRDSATAALIHAGILAHHLGRHAEARAFQEEALQIHARKGHKEGAAWCLNNLGDIALAEGKSGEAGRRFREALSHFLELRHWRGVADCLRGIGEALSEEAVSAEQHQHAARLLGSAEALRSQIRTALGAIEKEAHTRRVGALRETLGEVDFELAWNEGRRLTPDAAAASASKET